MLAVGWAGSSWFAVVLGGVILLGAAVAAVPPIWRFVSAAAMVPAMLEGVVAEFRPNGGGSLSDRINQMVETMEYQTITFEQHLTADEVFFSFAKERFEEHETFVEYTHGRFHDLLNEHQKTLLLLALPEAQRSDLAQELLARRDGTVRTRSTDEGDTE